MQVVFAENQREFPVFVFDRRSPFGQRFVRAPVFLEAPIVTAGILIKLFEETAHLFFTARLHIRSLLRKRQSLLRPPRADDYFSASFFCGDIRQYGYLYRSITVVSLRRFDPVPFRMDRIGRHNTPCFRRRESQLPQTAHCRKFLNGRRTGRKGYGIRFRWQRSMFSFRTACRHHENEKEEYRALIHGNSMLFDRYSCSCCGT